MANDNYNSQQDAVNDESYTTSSNTNNNNNSNSSSRHVWSNMIDPLQFSTFLFVLLLLFVFYLLLPRGIRKQYFYAHPKRHAWTARNTSGTSGSSSRSSSLHHHPQQQQQQQQQQYRGGHASTPIGLQSSMETGSFTAGSSILGSGTAFTAGSASAVLLAQQQQQPSSSSAAMMMTPSPNNNNMMMMGLTGGSGNDAPGYNHSHPTNSVANENNEIVISAAMQQLRDPGVLIVAHGSRGKPKTVRLSLTETSITWRTETRKMVPPSGGNNNNKAMTSMVPKMGKLHSVPLAHIMYVDVGKQTTALRRVENASVPDILCFSLLTKEGSLDLEAASSRERDALVSCFSLVLDEVHSAQNWRDIYRGPSSDMPSSFDEFDNQQQPPSQQQQLK